MTATPAVLIVYDLGSLAPTRIAQAARENGVEPVFAVAGSAHGRDALALLELLGPTIPLDDDPDELLRTLEKRRPAGIVTFSEIQLARTAHLADRLGLPYHRLADLPAVIDKERQRLRFAEAGLEAVRFRAVRDAGAVPEAVAYVGAPAMIKPVIGAGSRNTVVAWTPAEAEAQAAALLGGERPAEDGVLIEEYLIGRDTPAPWGDTVCVDCVADGDEVVPVFISGRFALAPPFRERGGYGGRTRDGAAELAAARRLACDAVRALGMRSGIADVEVKFTADGPRLIEVNGRLGAWVDDLAVRSRTSDPAGVAIRSALGRRPEVGESDAGPIAFHYLVQPPREATRVRAVHDADALRRIEAVDRVSLQARPGDRIDWRLGTRSVAALQGVVDDLDRLAEVVEQIEKTDWIAYG